MKGMGGDDSLSNVSNEASMASSTTQPPSKKRRNLPGNPDPESEVVALSPGALMATNRFVCEICNKGFQRDQNLQLHRRGHNLPWKLKQRNKLEIMKKKVYVCPEPSCVHHHPCRALGDLTGIKKHFFRKHGEKKWKCEKCSKRYAVQSDWKAHSKICGTREYRCDCGTLFSRRDSFITHRAFCDALAEESCRSMTQTPLFSSQTPPFLKQESHETLNFNFPPCLLPSQPNPNPNFIPSPFVSATGLLQKAAQAGATMSKSSQNQDLMTPHHHVTNTTAGMPSRDEMGTAFLHGLASYGNKIANLTSGCMQLQDINIMGNAFDGFDQHGFNGIFNTSINPPTFQDDLGLMRKECGSGGDGMTRDFLGLRAFPNGEFGNMPGFDQMGSSSYDHQTPWQS